MNKSLVAAFAALSAPVISLTTEHWDRYDQSVHVPLWSDPSYAYQAGGSPDSDSTQPQTGGGPNGAGQTLDPEDYSNYVNPADCCRKHDGDLAALLAEIEAVEAEIRMNESNANFGAALEVVAANRAALAGRIARNEADLTELDSSSGANEGEVQALAERAATNEGGAGSNEGGLAGVDGKNAANKAALGALRTRLDTNEGDVA